MSGCKGCDVCRVVDVPCCGWCYAAAWWVCLQVTSESPEFPKLVFETFPFFWSCHGTFQEPEEFYD